jgi:hypothetical protein
VGGWGRGEGAGGQDGQLASGADNVWCWRKHAAARNSQSRHHAAQSGKQQALPAHWQQPWRVSALPAAQRRSSPGSWTGHSRQQTWRSGLLLPAPGHTAWCP